MTRTLRQRVLPAFIDQLNARISGWPKWIPPKKEKPLPSLKKSAVSGMNPILANFLIGQLISIGEGAVVILMMNPAVAARWIPKLKKLRDSLNVVIGDQVMPYRRKRG